MGGPCHEEGWVSWNLRALVVVSKLYATVRDLIMLPVLLSRLAVSHSCVQPHRRQLHEPILFRNWLCVYYLGESIYFNTRKFLEGGRKNTLQSDCNNYLSCLKSFHLFYMRKTNPTKKTKLQLCTVYAFDVSFLISCLRLNMILYILTLMSGNNCLKCEITAPKSLQVEV